MAANLLPVEEYLKVSPSLRATKWSEQNDLFRNARRLLGDFWATPQLSSQSPYFDIAAQRWIDRGSLAFEAFSEDKLTGPRKLTTSRLEQARLNARDWQLLLNNSGSAIASDSLDLTLAWNAERFPKGEARLNVFINQEPTAVAKLVEENAPPQVNAHLPVGNPAVVNQPPVKRTIEKIPEGNFEQHLLVATFRGHIATLPFYPPRQEKPRVLGWNMEPTTPATVQVKAVSKPRRIVFILDCSKSLGPANLIDAKTQLQNAIARIDDPQIEIAVMFFGHSRQWDKVGKDVINPKWNALHPNIQHRPYDDVDLVWSFGRPATSNGQLVDALRKEFDAVESWGNTPLYLSIKQACELFQTNPPYQGNQQIIVVTDGVDDVYPRYPKDFKDESKRGQQYRDWPDLDSRYILSASSVRNALPPGNNFRLDIIQYRMQGTFPGDFQQLINEDNRIFAAYSANDGSALDKAIRATLYSDRYNVFAIDDKTGRRSNQSINRGELDFSTPLPDIGKEPPLKLPSDFVVAINDAGGELPLLLFGGERIEVEYDRGRTERFSFPEFGRNRQFSIVNDRLPYLSATLPSSKIKQSDLANEVRLYRFRNREYLRVALESTDQHKQSRRPKRAMVELKESEDAQIPIAWTSEVLWEPNYAVPVLSVPIGLTRLMPDASTQQLRQTRIQARVWLRTKDSPPQQLTYSELSNKANLANGVTLSAKLEQTFDKTTLEVTETFSPGDNVQLQLLDLQIEPMPDVSLEHRFYGKRVVHQYVYSKDFVERSGLDRQSFKFNVSNVSEEDWVASKWFDATDQ